MMKLISDAIATRVAQVRDGGGRVIAALLLFALATVSGADTRKPVLHGRHRVAITGKPLAATAGAHIFLRGGNAVEVGVRDRRDRTPGPSNAIWFDRPYGTFQDGSSNHADDHGIAW